MPRHASSTPSLCSCGLRSHHPGLCKVRERRNALTRRIEQLNHSAQQAPHGTNSRYVGGKCRCDLCRQAARTYARNLRKQRAQGFTNRVISAQRARDHLFALSAAGIGYKTLADAAGVGKTILQEIRAGYRQQIREQTERRILSVDLSALPDTAKVDAGPTWKLLNELITQGYAKAQLARWLGAKTPGLQIKKTKVRASTALAVEKLYRRLQETSQPKSTETYALLNPAPTWKLIDELLGDGYTLRQLAKWLGHKNFPINRKIPRMRAATAQRIAQLYREIRAGLRRRS